jgi:uncharacterized YigZ family protein
MNYPEQMVTIDDFAEVSYKEKGSQFIGQVYHCETENDAVKNLSSIKKKYYDATHHCFAYKFVNEHFKYSDDGEPAGTAGIRLYNAIEHFKLFNVLVVVIRYYGGIKLGVGSLGRAYYKSAVDVLNKAEKLIKHYYEKVLIESSFDNISHIHRILSNHRAIIENSEYNERAIFECLIRPLELNIITTQLTDLSKGKIEITNTQENYYR